MQDMCHISHAACFTELFSHLCSTGKTLKRGAGRDDQSFYFLPQKGVKRMHLCGDQIGFTAQTKTNVLQTLSSRVKGWVQTGQKEPKRGVWRLNRRKSLLAIIYLRATSADWSAKKGTAVWFVCSIHISCGCGRENHLTVVFSLMTHILDFSVPTLGNSYSPVSFRQLFSKL